LLCAAGLLIRSLTNLQNQHFGFETQNRYILHIDPQMAGYKAEQSDAFFRQLHDAMAGIPGVKEVTYSLYSPMEGDNWGEDVWIEGQAPPAPGSGSNNASWDRVSAGYFDNLGTKIIAGRPIQEQDTAATRNVAVVNETFAKKFFKNGNVIGQHFGDEDPKYAGNFEIVGIAEDTQYWDPNRKMRPMFFLPALQWAEYDDPAEVMFENVSHLEMSAIEIQTAGYVPGLEAQVRRVLTQINPDLTMVQFQSFGEQVRDRFNQQELLVELTSVFGFLALALAAIGLYGVTAYSVAQRTREIGIRMALGADRSGVLQMVLRNAFLQAGIGLAIGMPAAIFGGRFMASLLYNVKTWDPVVLIATTAILALAAFLAAVIPAQRAASVEPMTALRVE
jgi:predicted permease